MGILRDFLLRIIKPLLASPSIRAGFRLFKKDLGHTAQNLEAEGGVSMAWQFHIPTDESVPYQVTQDGIIVGTLRDGNPQLSPHFFANEFACPCCKEYHIAIEVLEGLEQARDLAGVPLAVAQTTLDSPLNPLGSGYRCPAHNARVEGASKKSNHMLGIAVDVSVPSGILSTPQLAGIMERIPVFKNGGIGIYSNFVHVDSGKRRRWRGK